MQHVSNNSFPVTPKLNSYKELIEFVESYRRSPLYDMRETNGLIFEFETNKVTASFPPLRKVYYKYQSELLYKEFWLTLDQANEFIIKYGIETTDKQLLEQVIGFRTTIKQQNIKVFC
jgi:hypothetical protein